MIDWDGLLINPNAIHLIEANIDKINLSNWDIYWCNRDKNLHATLLWGNLSLNPNALHLLKTHPEKFNWFLLSMNPGIFEVDMIQYKTDITEKTDIIFKILNKN